MANKKLIIACLSGTTIEWFDLSLFGVLSATFAGLFFPSESPTVSLLKAFTVFALGFLVRPLGSFFWGYYGDKIGRKKTIILTVVLMTLSTSLIGFLPTYNQIGVMAPIALVVLRLIQGFSASGEQAGVMTYLFEQAPFDKKKLFTSIPMVGVYAGMSLSILAGLLITLFLEDKSVNEWGWRLPFILSLFLGYVGYKFRITLSESKSFQNYISSLVPIPMKKKWLGDIGRSVKKLLLWVGLFQLAVIIPYIVFVYMVAYPIKITMFEAREIYFVTFINLLITATAVAFFSKLSERFDRSLQLASLSGLLLSVFIYKGFFYASLMIYFLLQLYYGLFTAMLVGPFCADIAKAFPIHMRCTSLAICINFTAAIFGGLIPLIMTSFELTEKPILYSSLLIFLSCLIAISSQFYLNREK